MDYLLQLFKGVANQTRIKIVELLLDNKEHTIEELSEKLRIPIATCCRNLKILEKVYLVESKRRKGFVFYRLHNPTKHIYNKLLIELINLRKKRISEKAKR